MSLYFENGSPVPTADFDYGSIDERLSEDRELSARDASRLRREVIARTMAFLTDRGSVKFVGQQAIVTAFIIKATPAIKTQKQLAEKLGVSAGRVSQILKSAKRGLTKLATAK